MVFLLTLSKVTVFLATYTFVRISFGLKFVNLLLTAKHSRHTLAIHAGYAQEEVNA
jgi:hypothetical protein